MSAIKARNISFVLFAISITLFIIGFLVSEAIMLFFIGSGMVLIITARIILLLYWRCSNCEKGLPSSEIIGIEYCPYCGSNIE